MGTLSLTLSVACIVMVCVQYSADVSNLSSTYLPSHVSQSLSALMGSFNLIFNNLSSFILKSSSHKTDSQENIFTKEKLLSFKFKYLAIAGDVFDVATEKGIRHYGVDGHYNFFTGIDGTRAFVTGDFTEAGLIDDITGLSAADVQGVENWRLMYHKDYKYIGKVIGRFYDSDGKETEHKILYTNQLKEAKRKKIEETEIKKIYPPCNSEFKNQASRLWCSNRSGGITREWIGVPRKLFTVGSSHFRCACVRTTGPPSSDLTSKNHKNRGDLDNPNLREYDNCDPMSPSCPI